MSRQSAIAKLLVATALFALGPVVLKALVVRGGQFGLTHAGAISFCNVLFVGNFCAGLVTLVLYGARPLLRELLSVDRKALGILVLGALCSTIYPALLFSALEHTSVINVVVLSRLNGIVLVLLSWLFLRTAVRAAELVGYAVITFGVCTLMIVNHHGVGITSGEALVLLATVAYALLELVNKAAAVRCSMQLYVFFRNAGSALIFFGIALKLFGPHHFAEAFVGELWILMVIYAGLVIVTAQLLWLGALKLLSVQALANVQLLNPVLSIAYAYFLLREAPGGAQWAVMAVVAIGMLIPRLANVREALKPKRTEVLAPVAGLAL